jgi:multimeric flavodoxin WrbA
LKTLILNGSPHKNGDTAYIINKLKEQIEGEFIEINAYFDDIEPCNDCRYCWKNEGCAKSDNMNIIYNNDYDNVIVASPIYMSNITPPLFSILTRLNWYWSNKYFLGIEKKVKGKHGIVVLTGGGDGAPTCALEMCRIILKYLNAKYDIEKDYIFSLKTNTIPANKDENLDYLITKAINNLHAKNES